MLERYAIKSVDRTEVLRYMGYKGQVVADDLDVRIDKNIEHAIDVSRPKGSVRFFDIADRVEPGEGAPADALPEIRLVGTALTLRGRAVCRHLRDAVAVGVLCVTLGMENERELKRLSLTNGVDHVMFDAASTTLVERAADAAEAQIVAEACERGLYTNFRFSPGFGDMPLDTQPVLLATLDAQRLLGVTLAPSLLMTPTKSVTAVVGMCPTRQRSTHGRCETCGIRDFCTVRTTGRTCHDER